MRRACLNFFFCVLETAVLLRSKIVPYWTIVQYLQQMPISVTSHCHPSVRILSMSKTQSDCENLVKNCLNILLSGSSSNHIARLYCGKALLKLWLLCLICQSFFVLLIVIQPMSMALKTANFILEQCFISRRITKHCFLDVDFLHRRMKKQDGHKKLHSWWLLLAWQGQTFRRRCIKWKYNLKTWWHTFLAHFRLHKRIWQRINLRIGWYFLHNIVKTQDWDFTTSVNFPSCPAQL